MCRAGKIVLRSLAMRELTVRHTAHNLRNILVDILSQYDIDIQKIYTVTTDNGANMLSSVRLLSEQQLNETNDYLDLSRYSQLSGEEDNYDDCKSDDFLADDLLNVVQEAQRSLLSGINCCAHTIQLAVQDALKCTSATELLKVARSIVKQLKCQNLMMILRQMKSKMPILDCVTRWSSSYCMLDRLLELRKFCKEMEETVPTIYLSEVDWNNIAKLRDTLKPVQITTSTIQLQQLTPGDFLKAWMKCKIDVCKIHSIFSVELLRCMEVREQTFLENDVIRAAIYMDPRHVKLLKNKLVI